MTGLVQLVIALIALTAAAQARITAVVLGMPVSVPVLGVVALAVVLVLAIVVLGMLRSVLRYGRPRLVTR